MGINPKTITQQFLEQEIKKENIIEKHGTESDMPILTQVVTEKSNMIKHSSISSIMYQQ